MLTKLLTHQELPSLNTIENCTCEILWHGELDEGPFAPVPPIQQMYLWPGERHADQGMPQITRSNTVRFTYFEPWERQNRYSKLQGNWWTVFFQKQLPFLMVFDIGYNLCKTSMPVNVTSSLTMNTNSRKQGLPAPSRTTNVLSPRQ